MDNIKEITKVIVRHGEPKDVSGIHYCISKLSEHVELSEYFTVSVQELGNSLFDPTQTHVDTFVAQDEEGNIIGYAITYKTLSTFTGKTNDHMEDLFVRSTYRNSGVGEQIMDFVKKFCQENNASKLDWYVHQSNPKDKKFYERLGSKCIDSEVKYELNF